MADSAPLSTEKVTAITGGKKDPATKDFQFVQTMYRIKDPEKSLEFYSNVLGMTLLQKYDFPEAKFSVYRLGYENPEDVPKDEKERNLWGMTRKATLELTHNWGTENNPEFAYKTGNKDGIGYGNIGILVPDVEEACKRFEEQGVDFLKKPNDGNMKGLAFIRDPDGYSVEIYSAAFIARSLNQ